MPILPTLADARDLRIAYADNPIIDQAETALRAWHVTALDDAAAKLPMWAHVGDLSQRERLAVLARFVCVQVVDGGARVCGHTVAGAGVCDTCAGRSR